MIALEILKIVIKSAAHELHNDFIVKVDFVLAICSVLVIYDHTSIETPYYSGNKIAKVWIAFVKEYS